MSKFSVEFPYPIGTILYKEEHGILHVDSINEYIVNENGTFVIVVLDTFTKPRLSEPINLECFVSAWHLTEEAAVRVMS